MADTSFALNGGAASPNTLWEEEKKYRYNCEILTGLLRGQVPVLDYVQWHVDDLDQGMARTVLPLNSPSTNQHCTHQAALLFLSADYTGGIALASLMPGWPVVGVHPVGPREKSMALWLVKGEIKYLRPSVGRLDIVAEIEPERFDRVRRRFAQGRAVLETVTVRFRNGDVDVAEAEMVYFARQTDRLRADGVSPDKVNILYQHKLVSSAELIAGVRARESGGLFEDPFAARIAGEHGIALAARFCDRSPQLGGMVAARTRHLDEQILKFVHNGGRDLVLLGAGYDLRPFRLDLPDGMCVYEVDFPTVLTDRQRRLTELGITDPPNMRRIPVSIDLRTTPLAVALGDIAGGTDPIFVAWEGMSMYFEEAEVRAILDGIAPVLKNNRSRLWFDCVDERAIRTPEIFPEVAAFMNGMQLLGEPFVFGTSSVEAFMKSNDYRCLEVVSSDVFLADTSDPVYSIYRFCVAAAAYEMAPEGIEAGAVWVAHKPHEVSSTQPQHELPAKKISSPK
jgi:methyltransferase (TIGR00027 family)